MNDAKRLTSIIESGSKCISISTYEEEEAVNIIRSVSTNMYKVMLTWSVCTGIKNGLMKDSDANDDTIKPENALKCMGLSCKNTICVTLDLLAHLKQEKILRQLRETIKQIEQNDGILIMIDGKGTLPEVIRPSIRQFELSLPEPKELEQIVISTLKRIHSKTPIEIGITRKGMVAIIRNLRGLTYRQAQQLIQEAVADDRRFDDKDINTILAGKRRMIQSDGLLEYIRTPLDLNEIGGMSNLKQWLNLRKDSFGQKARDFGLTAPRGVLMLGVQGAGKSLCAKAIATAWQQPLLRLDPGTLYGSYIGESEKNLRQALKQIEMMAPVVLWIDEIEKAFASAASKSADGGLSQRMFGTLLTWMQEHTEPVFVVATANDIEALPSELLRKGRFDEIFFVDLPTVKVRQEIFSIHLKKRNRDPKNFDLTILAETAQGFSGAEIEQTVISALYEAYSQDKQLDTNIIISAIQASPPISITMKEKIQELRSWASKRCVPAD